VTKKDATVTVLLADDHSIVRGGIRDILNKTDDITVVAEASDGKAARQLTEAHEPDVLVLDIRLPGGSGIEVARWARVAYPDMAILMLSAYDDAPFVEAALQTGVNGYLLKTASPEAILNGIRDVHRGKSAFDSVITQKVMDFVAGGSGSALQTEALSERELEVLTLASKGETNNVIGEQLGISGRTVQGHLARIYRKLHVNTRTEAVMRAVAFGLITVETED
jgi:DNA-binding NarL/FixJ family response regulator